MMYLVSIHKIYFSYHVNGGQSCAFCHFNILTVRLPFVEFLAGTRPPQKRIALDGYKLTDVLFPAHNGDDLLGFFVPCWHDCPCSFLLSWSCSSPYSTNRTALDCFGRNQYLDYVQSRFLKMVAMGGNGHLFIDGHCVIEAHAARIQQSYCIR